MEEQQTCGCDEGKVPDRHGRCVMPEVTFAAFIMSLNTSVLFHLGELTDPTTGRTAVDFDLARNAIDTLVMLEQKTRGNLSHDEEELLKSIVYDSKIRFVKAVRD
ncbi:MAG: DUF1844 domain-containing protein [Desulfobulbaceae bacterium]|jgi:hypothetical protein|nr:DUF1844 domain-containing protein [Desulfobulbaceae bacterium]